MISFNIKDDDNKSFIRKIKLPKYVFEILKTIINLVTRINGILTGRREFTQNVLK